MTPPLARSIFNLMVNYQIAALDRTFAALADPTRRAIILRLARRSATVGELAKPFAMSLPAVSKHLKVLEGAGLVARRRVGRVHHLSARIGPMSDAARWIEVQRRFWERSLDRLAEHLNSEPEESHDVRDQDG
ncbi:MAG: ArsR/SmtB family transcription factor [Alphaproteobacteria bacterium]